MPSTLTYDQCLKEMFALGRFGIKLELDTIAGILERLGRPQQAFPSVHIAGTNGKGSVAATIAAILKAGGQRAGLYTSPHLIRFNERFSIDGTPVTDSEIVQAYTAVKAADTGERKATFFELATAMAFYLFHRNQVDWAVIETGMGGRMDATNILDPLVSIITNLSLEHTDYLGDTLTAIAFEKAGIIKQGIPVITGVHQPEALSVIQEQAQKKNAPLFVAGQDFSATALGGGRFTYEGIYTRLDSTRTPLTGAHQVHNTALALAACEILGRGDTPGHSLFHLSDNVLQKGMAATAWPGRLEKIMDTPRVILDGAHNLHAAENLARYLKEEERPDHLTLVLGILDDKPWQEMLAHLVPLAHRIILTRAQINRSLSPEELARVARPLARGTLTIAEPVEAAVERALADNPDGGTICIAGSLYVAGEARACILDRFLRHA